jgi:hypothetical protein
MNESQFTRNVNKRLPKNVKSWKIIDQYEGGVPDCFYRLKTATTPSPLWVEFKYLKALPKRETTLIKPNLSELQIQWLTEASEACELTAVVIGYGSKGVVYTLSEALNGIEAGDFIKRMETYQQLADHITTTLGERYVAL